MKHLKNMLYSEFEPNGDQPRAIEILSMNRRADTGKAQRELGYRPTSVRDAVREAYEFFVAQGKIPGARLSDDQQNPRSEIIAAK